MRTFHKDTDKTLASNLKTAAKNTMQAVVKAGKTLPSGLRKSVVIAAAAMALATPNAQAQGFLGKVLGGVEKTLAQVEKTAQDIGRPFYTLNRQFDRTQQAINYTERDIRGTGERVASVAAPVVNVVNGIRNQRNAAKLMEQMEAQQNGQIPLIAEDGQAQMVSPQNYQRSAAQSSTGLNVVGEVSLDELMSRGNVSVSETSAPSRSNAVHNVAGEITLDQLTAYQQAHSTSRTASADAVRARQADVRAQKSGETVSNKGESQVKKKNTKSAEELLAQMVREGYVK